MNGNQYKQTIKTDSLRLWVLKLWDIDFKVTMRAIKKGRK